MTVILANYSHCEINRYPIIAYASMQHSCSDSLSHNYGLNKVISLTYNTRQSSQQAYLLNTFCKLYAVVISCGFSINKYFMIDPDISLSQFFFHINIVPPIRRISPKFVNLSITFFLTQLTNSPKPHLLLSLQRSCIQN